MKQNINYKLYLTSFILPTAQNYRYASSLLQKIFTIVVLFFVISCSSNNEDVNSIFIERYGQKVAEIKKYRTQPQYLENKVFYFRSPTKEEVEKSFSRSKYNKYRYVDVDQFNDVQEDILDEQLRIGALSPRIFDIVYFTKNHGSFATEIDYFANIKIPKKDAYGIPTKFSSKPYLLVSDKSLKDGVDYILYNNRNSKHLKQSKLLIEERTKLRRQQRMEKILGKKSY